MESQRRVESISPQKHQFEKISELGKGGQGSVWLVRDKVDGKAYAAKFVNVALFGGEKVENPLEREYNALSQLRSHPNIIKTEGLHQVQDCFEIDQTT